ncbi:MAG: hypothetical protein EBE86_031295 [Hormoscilla sp. GUM202]|nr:hypothetical protein [Hormoscilla sp. GUM202]
METTIREAIVDATSQGRFLDDRELELVAQRLERAAAYFAGAKYLAENASVLMEGAVQAASSILPEDACGPDAKEKYLREVAFYLRQLQYRLVAQATSIQPNSTGSWQTIGYSFFDLPIDGAIAALKYLKGDRGLPTWAAKLVNAYIDASLEILSALQEKHLLIDETDNGKVISLEPEEKPLWKRLMEIGARVPDEEWAKLPRDLARNFEHYMYGAPKEE